VELWNLVKDSDSLMEEIDLFCTPDYPMPPGIVDKDCDSERDILIPKDLPSNNSLSFAEKESFHFDIPLFSPPLAKPPDGNTGILNIKMMGDIFDQKAFMHKLMITLASHQEKSPDLLSHRCRTVKKFNTHRTVEDNILVPKPPNNCARCTRCGYLVDGPNCQGCALLRQELEENLVTYSPDFQSTFEPSNASTNNSLNDSPSIFETSSQSPPNINHCCYECGDPLDGIFCKCCTCKSCGKDAHIGYNCPSKFLVISNPKPCNNQTIDELPQVLQIFHPTFHSEDESPFTLDSTPTFVDESPNVFNLPPHPLVYPCEFCGNDAYYGHYCTPQAPFIYPEQCYNQDFNFPQDFSNCSTTISLL
nr:hypothetical protein [Tanacetum cinerariifolium]